MGNKRLVCFGYRPKSDRSPMERERRQCSRAADRAHRPALSPLAREYGAGTANGLPHYAWGVEWRQRVPKMVLTPRDQPACRIDQAGGLRGPATSD